MEKNIVRLDTIQDYTNLLGSESPLHPLVTVTDLATSKGIPHCVKSMGFYAIYLKELDCGTIQYGRSKYDYQEGTMLFVAPGQGGGADDGGVTLNLRGFVLMFHPDLLYGTPLASRIKDYSFFAYTCDEALHMSEREKTVIFAASCVESAARELNISAKEMHQRMKRVNLVDGYILKHYNAIHSESRKHITEDIVGCLLDWEKSLLGKEVAQ